MLRDNDIAVEKDIGVVIQITNQQVSIPNGNRRCKSV